MPGIHVRSIGRLHWENQDKEPILTVPGSYWLCHKNNIYKFTFKFLHKTNRNAEEFCHSKELMKIIRRVIKRQPRQGQHFSTKNLLVTYQHASWTRQDKMFAVMKFCDRPDAIAFPHAFILTVKVLNQEQQQQNQEKMGSALSTKSEAESSAAASLLDIDLTPNCSPIENSREDNKTELVSNVSVNGHQEKENKHDVSWSLRTRSRLKDSDSNGSTNTSVSTDNSSEKSERSINGKQEEEKTTNIADSSSSSSSGTRDMDCSLLEKVAGTSLQTNNLDNQNKKEEVENEAEDDSDTHSESASLPYQYLIERDIERELENSRNASKLSSKETKVNGITSPCDSSLGNDVEDSKSSSKDSRKSVKLRMRQESKDGDSMPPPDVANLRSSDITDLVMKGLMFTIRQDKDTVTVVEQKTKLELDEVLENSEKVETKEGDPCLLNSSLLKLEKMITRIQGPDSLPEQRHNQLCDNALASFIDLADEINMETEAKISEADIAERKELNRSTPTLETANCWSDFFPDKDISDSALENIEKALDETNIYIDDDNGDGEIELKIDDEDEDIIPEALVHNSFLESALEAVTNTAPTLVDTFQDLLMDDIEPNIISFDKKEDSKSMSLSQGNGVFSPIKQHKNSSNLPKVISNQIITNDQIPPGLLKALKNKPYHQHQQQQQVQEQEHQQSSNNELTTINENNCENNNKISIDSVENKTDIKQDENNSSRNKSSKIDANEESHAINNGFSLHENKESNVTVNTDNCAVSDFINTIQKTLESSIGTDNLSEPKPNKNTNVKSSDISNSNSNSIDNIRLTRSNTRLSRSNSKCESPLSNTRILKEEQYIERKSQRTEKNLNKQINKALIDKTVLRQKRKSISEQCATKFYKSASVNGVECKEVRINVLKLISDITYGVKVVVERMDDANISR